MRETATLATACLVLGLQTSCSDAELTLLTPEEATSFQTWVVWVDGVAAASSGGALRLELDPDRSEVVLAVYEPSLVELGLRAGPLPEPAACRSCALLKPRAAWRREVNGDEGDGWTPLHPLPDVVKNALVPDRERCEPCRPFRPTGAPAVERPSPGVVAAFVTPWEDGALVGYTDGTLKRLAPQRPSEPACVPTETFRPHAGYRATENVTWIVDVTNRVFRLDLDRLDPARSCDEAATLSSTVAWAGPPLWSITGPPTATPESLFGLGIVHGGTRSVLSRYTLRGETHALGELDEADNELGVVWAPPNRVLAVNGGRTILRTEDGVTRQEKVVAGGRELFITSVTHHPTRGFLLGSSNNLALVENAEGKFEFLRETGLSQRVETILGYRAGLVIGERNGVFRQFYDDAGYCPSEQGFGAEGLHFLVETAGGALLGGSSRLFFHPPPEDECAPQP